MDLHLTVRDREVIDELERHEGGPPREQFALAALRVGVLALRQASGALDATTVREEGQRLLSSVKDALHEHAEEQHRRVTSEVEKYFDPKTGQLPQRLERLFKEDGELAGLIAKHVGPDSSTLAKTLADRIGDHSPLMQKLDPTRKDGLIGSLSAVIFDALKSNRESIIDEFSLNRKESALSRLVAELKQANGELKKGLGDDVNKVSKEFSLDNPDGALSKLVARVDKTQQLIAGEFSLDDKKSALSRMSVLMTDTKAAVDNRLTLDDEKSPLARMHKALQDVIADLQKSANEFQTEVRTTLATLTERKREAARSTRHGVEFEQAVGDLLQHEAQRLCDVHDAVGAKGGLKPNRKTGDFIITLGPESRAPGARIVVEAKEKKDYDLVAAQKEIADARENRGAQVGIFVFSKLTAPDGLEPLTRYGNDIFIVWDRDESSTDIFVRAAVGIGRALAIRERTVSEHVTADFLAIEGAIVRIGKEAENIADIEKDSVTVLNAGDRIARTAKLARQRLGAQIEVLREHFDSLKQDSTPDVRAA